jgi:hypothetical protein
MYIINVDTPKATKTSTLIVRRCFLAMRILFSTENHWVIGAVAQLNGLWAHEPRRGVTYQPRATPWVLRE